jgi:hypothetical protein
LDSYCVLLEARRADEAASLSSWLRRQGTEVDLQSQPERMGGGEVIVASVIGEAALRALVVISREWIRAHRTRISVRLEGRGSFEVEGTTDIDELVDLLRNHADG